MTNEVETPKETPKVNIEEVIFSMTQANWILLRNRLDMTREQIAGDQGLLLLVVAWKHTGPTSDNLSKLLEVSERDLYTMLGIDPLAKDSEDE